MSATGIYLFKILAILIIKLTNNSRAVLCRKTKALRLSKDHKAEDSSEIERIRVAGGTVVKDRVMGILAVSRSFGDRGLKQFVPAKPYTSTVSIHEGEDEFIILACDGIWDVMTDQEAVDFVRLLDQNQKNQAAKLLVDTALTRSTSDNLTVVILFF